MQSRSAQASVSPPEFLRLAGHPLRWRLLSELAESDLIVQELSARVGEPQNLVSYHLGKLRGAKLICARQSSADRRDTYYRFDLAHAAVSLAATGEALHPGLLLALPRPNKAVRPTARVLFLCTGNSARSHMAEALIKARSLGSIKAVSAGSDPKPLHPNAVRAMRDEFGIDLAGHTSKHLSRFTDQHFDRVVSLCDRVREVCPKFPGAPKTIHWSIANPVTGEPDEVTYPLFQDVARELSERIDFLIATLAGPAQRQRTERRKGRRG